MNSEAPGKERAVVTKAVYPVHKHLLGWSGMYVHTLGASRPLGLEIWDTG